MRFLRTSLLSLAISCLVCCGGGGNGRVDATSLLAAPPEDALSAPRASCTLPCEIDGLVNTEPPKFSPDSTRVDHPLHLLPPLGETSTKTLTNEDGDLIIYRCTARSRVFEYPSGSGETVTCRVLEKRHVEDDETVEIATSFVAQSKNGSIWEFGEIVEEFEDGVSLGFDESWVVGPPGATDPLETLSVAAPFTRLPPYPLQVGQAWITKNFLPAHFVLEVSRVDQVDATITTPHGDFTNAIIIIEDSPSDPDADEAEFYLPLTGLVGTQEDDDDEGETEEFYIVL